MNNGRDCPHGRQVGKCDTCDLIVAELELQKVTAERNALAAQVEKLKERNRKLDVDLLRALFYAPSSPVSPDKAYEIEVWYGKFKQVHLASKEGES